MQFSQLLVFSPIAHLSFVLLAAGALAGWVATVPDFALTWLRNARLQEHGQSLVTLCRCRSYRLETRSGGEVAAVPHRHSLGHRVGDHSGDAGEETTYGTAGKL